MDCRLAKRLISMYFCIICSGVMRVLCMAISKSRAFVARAAFISHFI